MNSKRGFKKQKGSLTVEAALVLPIFLCAILTIGFLTQIIYTHEIIQHGITEAANEVASSSYIYYISGVYDIDDTLSSELEEKKKKSKEHFDKIFECYEELNDFTLQTKGNLSNTLNNVVEDISSDPKGEMVSLASYIAKAGYDKGRTELGNMIIGHYIKKYGLTDDKIQNLHIDKLDFSQSSYFDNDQDIDVIVKYNVDIPLPIKFINDIHIVQRATVRAWMGGDDSTLTSDDEINELDSEETKVYVSEYGSKYHRFGCYHIFKKIEALDLQEAKKLGLDACEK